MRVALTTLLCLSVVSSALSAQPTTGRATLTCDADLTHYSTDLGAAKRAERLLNEAMRCWMDFDGYEHRNNSSNGQAAVANDRLGNKDGSVGPNSSDDALRTVGSASGLHGDLEFRPIDVINASASQHLREGYAPLPFDVAGETDYLKMKQLASEAYAIQPNNQRAYLFLGMLAVARSNWAELERLAQERIRRDTNDANARLHLALARYRLKPSKNGRALFDSALVRLSAAERKRLDRYERILRPKEIPSFSKLDAAEREKNLQATWFLAEPLWSSQQADPRTEFLARVAFADLRWSLGEAIRGADTDRGNIYIRYGPPNQVMGIQNADISASDPGTVKAHEFWVYNASLAFAFKKTLHTGTATFEPDDAGILARTLDWQPARWDNIASSRIDSMPTQVARFRSGPDTVEAFIATRAPVEVLELVGLSSARPSAHFWLYGLDSPAAFVDSTTVGTTGELQWTRRMGAGSYYYRIESTIPGTLVAGRAASGMAMGADSTSGFAMRGFGLSDLLIATSTNESSTARRWIDFEARPLLGDVKQGAQISLVWENYELANRNNQAQYEVTVSIDRASASRGKIGAQIMGLVSGTIGIKQTDDRLEMKFDRTVPYAATVADNVALSLGATPPGTYILTLRVSDRVSGRATSRFFSLSIAK